MIVIRILGWLLVALAVAALGWEALAAWQEGAWNIVPLGQLWFKLDPQSLNAAQAGIQRHVAPWLWDPVVTTILHWPAWAVLGAPGLLLIWAGRRRD